MSSIDLKYKCREKNWNNNTKNSVVGKKWLLVLFFHPVYTFVWPQEASDKKFIKINTFFSTCWIFTSGHSTMMAVHMLIREVCVQIFQLDCSSKIFIKHSWSMKNLMANRKFRWIQTTISNIISAKVDEVCKRILKLWEDSHWLKEK